MKITLISPDTNPVYTTAYRRYLGDHHTYHIVKRTASETIPLLDLLQGVFWCDTLIIVGAAITFPVLLLIIIATLLARKRVIVSHVSIDAGTSRLLMHLLVRQADHVSVQGDRAYAQCQQWGIDVVQVPHILYAYELADLLPDPPPTPLADCLNIALTIAAPPITETLALLNEAYPLCIHSLGIAEQPLPGARTERHEGQTLQEIAEVVAQADLVIAGDVETAIIAEIIGKPVYQLEGEPADPVAIVDDIGGLLTARDGINSQERSWQQHQRLEAYLKLV